MVQLFFFFLDFLYVGGFENERRGKGRAFPEHFVFSVYVFCVLPHGYLLDLLRGFGGRIRKKKKGKVVKEISCM